MGRFRYDGFSTADYEDFCEEFDVENNDVNADLISDNSSPDAPNVMSSATNYCIKRTLKSELRDLVRKSVGRSFTHYDTDI